MTESNRKNRKHPNKNIIKINYDTEESSGELRLVLAKCQIILFQNITHYG